MSCSDNDSTNSGSSPSREAYFDEYGQFGYALEPEYTEEELHEMEAAESSRNQDILSNPRQFNTDWCSCTKCIVMPLMTECLCCHEFTLFDGNIELGECTSDNIDFRTVCLNPVVLETNYISFWRYKSNRGRAPDILTHSLSRLMAYRQFVCWVRKEQPLGKRNRVTIPACVVNIIKEAFPSQDGVYEGFKECESDKSDSKLL
ncbi:uncharacterized protein [Mytilus edulis]|uniref:uncharacterized protein n=1 Tax=Mytilus edulis TaxID=6550 RepID=UPI0039EEE798